MKDTSKKVVILNNFVSPYICEAILVLNECNPQIEDKVIAEAEKIVSDYIEKMKKNEQICKKSAQRHKKSVILCFASVLVAAAAIGLKIIFR